MTTWAEFAAQEDVLAAIGRRLFHQFGVSTGFLATVGRDGAPRLHPICPIVTDEGLYAFIVPGPKERDLRVDGRYALHAFLPDEVEEEFMVAGVAELIEDPAVRERAIAAYQARVPDDHRLFGFSVERVLHAAYRYRGDWPPTYRTWKASE